MCVFSYVISFFFTSEKQKPDENCFTLPKPVAFLVTLFGSFISMLVALLAL